MTDKEKLQRLIAEAEKLVEIRATYSLPAFSAWHSQTERFLSNKFGQKSVELKNFRNRLYAPLVLASDMPHDDSVECVRDLETTILELKDYLAEEEENNSPKDLEEVVSSEKVFIIHGHNGELKEALARLLEAQGLQAIILNEKANQGRTLIEKLEKYSDVNAAIALFTSDDLGRAKNMTEDMPRARQNVVFETGYFIGKFGRDHVAIIAEKDVELPSDLKGVVYTDVSNWKLEVCQELKAMNYHIDFNKLF